MARRAPSLSRSRLALAGLVLLALVLRLVAARQSMNVDEAFTAWLGAQPWPDFWGTVRLDSHPPLFYLMVAGWERVVNGDLLLRLPCILAGVALVPLALAFAERGRWVAAALVATSSWLIVRDAELRQYAILALLIWGSLYAFWRGRWAVYGGLLALSMYVQYLAFFVVPVPWVYLATQRRWADMRRLLGAQAAAGLAFLPWLPAFRQQLSDGSAAASQMLSTSVYARSPLDYMAEWVEVLSFGPALDVPPALLLAPMALAVYGLTALPRPLAVFLAVAWLVPVAELVALNLTRGMSLLTAKHAHFLFLPWYVAIAAGIARLPRTAGAVVLIGLLGANLVSFTRMQSDPLHAPPPWPSIVAWIEERAQDGDALVVSPRYHSLAVLRYARSPLPGYDVDPARAREQVPWLAGQHRRVWVVQTYHDFEDPQGLVRSAFESRYRPVEARIWPNAARFDVVSVTLYERQAVPQGR